MVRRARTSRDLLTGSNTRLPASHSSGRMRSSSTARLAGKMECSTPGTTEAADPGGAGPYKSSEEQEGREPDGVHFDRERARRLLEAVSGAQPAGREEGESGAPGIVAGRRRGGLQPVSGLTRASLCTTSRTSKLATLRNFRIHTKAVSTKFQVLSSWRSTGLAQPDPSRANYHSYLSLILHLHIASLLFSLKALQL